MADCNLLLVAIPEDTRKPEPINHKNKRQILLWYDFLPDLGCNIWEIFPQIFLTLRVWIKRAK